MHVLCARLRYFSWRGVDYQPHTYELDMALNRRELLKLFGTTGVVTAMGGMAALERVLEPMRAIPPAESGWIVASGKSPYALTLQWGKSDAEGMARYPLAFNQVFSVVQEPAGVFEFPGVTATRIQPGRNWVAWGLT